ncbi:6-phosphogluconolactonase [Hymenobacter chitinivorans]|uniref:6-phosphogluconolactonase n=1 Tax=Hymenobacter chitinivorans DSM 11115 TaxID=1121954 RepID=A0A2M9BS93_9BACT|nr:6-phosphogluconolactonase [Hymenobacter chitinivorans]PJJ60813.1 6-phosphogluconolactonase [Hymenobacter chitinivorans DSM 11115]
MPLHVHAAPDAVLHGLAEYFVAQARAAIAGRGRFSVALSGGNSPKKLYELLAAAPYRAQVAWDKVYFFFGDERNVPPTDPESNYRMAREALLDPLDIADAQVFPVDTSLPPAAAAEAYTRTIQAFFAPEDAVFDLVLLGLGDNSHTASLFPHTPVLHDTSVGAREVFVEEKQAYRITLTAPLLNQARAVAFLVYGADKAAAVQQVMQGARNVEEFPAQLIAPAGELHWFLDMAAAAALPPAAS